MKNKVFIRSIESGKTLGNTNAKIVARFAVYSIDDDTTLEQTLILTNEGDGWKAEMPMEEFPPQKTITATAWKLADWMERMAEAIREHTFDSFNLNEL